MNTHTNPNMSSQLENLIELHDNYYFSILPLLRREMIMYENNGKITEAKKVKKSINRILKIMIRIQGEMAELENNKN